MTLLEQLKQRWTPSENYQSGVQQRIWDRAADNFGRLPIPSFDDNEFLQLMADSLELTRDVRTLDVGCGSGIYSMALAERVGEAVGVDISPHMIAYANDRSRELGLTNTRFSCMDWSAADLDALGFRGAFDVAFAHMTPAVIDYDTFDKLNACSRRLCLVEKPTRRSDPLQTEIARRLGLEQSEQQYHSSTVEAFSYLWYKGYNPQFFYHDDVWESDKPVADTAAWYLDRIRLRRPVEPREEQAVTDYLEALAVDGKVHERTTVTRVTILWAV